MRGLKVVIVRPKTFIGPERLGVFEILFDWIREGRRIPILGSGENRYQLLAVEDLVDAIVAAAERDEAAGEAINVGAREFGTVRSDLQALIDHAGSGARLRPIPVKPAELVAPRARARAPVAARGMALQDRAPRLVRRRLEGRARCSTTSREVLERAGADPRPTTGTWSTARGSAHAGVTHRVPWNQQALAVFKRLS